MRQFSFRFLMLACVTVLIASCKEAGNTKATGPIVLGDPETIVTETDSQYLRDMVIDNVPARPAANPIDTATTAPSTDTAAAAQPAEAKPEPSVATEKGYTIDLNGVTISIPNITAKGSGTSYQLRKGELNGNRLNIIEGSIQKVSQRYQTVVVAKNNLGTLILDNLTNLTSWQSLKGNGKSYTISGLDDKRLSAPKATATSIRSAVSKAARKKRLSRSAEQKWIAAVKNTRSANQKPLSVALRSVMWKIDGKDAKGRPFSKQLRMDMPL